jgi:uncharacterized protein DUF397
MKLMPDLSIFTQWFKSPDSGGADNCVEASFASDGSETVAVRNSKDPAGPTVVYTGSEWDAFVSGVKQGAFDRS